MYYLRLFVIALVFSLGGCGSTSNNGHEPEPEPASTSANKLIFGWFDSNCFASEAKSLTPNTRITVVSLDTPQMITHAEILGPANAENCGPMAADRREQNEAEGFTFYSVKQEKEFGLAIGIIGEVASIKVVEGEVLADLTGKGNQSRFTLCATTEGLSFDIWASTPFEDEPLWSGYYYLAYDVERTCP